MRLERSKNTQRNILAGILNKLIVLALPFFTRTVFIYTLGEEYLGLNSLFTAILTVLNITELGFANAVVFSMYEPIANDDDETVCALLNFYKRVYRVIGGVILGIGVCLMPFLPYLINGECPDELNIYILYLLYLGNTVVSYLFFGYKKSLLEAFQRNDILSFVNTLTTGLTNLFQLILLVLWKDIQVYYVYVLILLILTVVNNLITSVIIDKKYPQYRCEGQISDKERKKLKKQVSGLMVSKLCQMTRNSLDSIFISAFIGLVMTAIYNNYYYIFSSVGALMSVLTSSMLAGVGNSIATESVEKNYRDFRMFNFMYMWLASLATVMMLCLYQNFMILWMGEDLTLPVILSVMFSLYFYLLKMGDMRAMYSSAVGLWWQNRYKAVFEVIMNIVLNALFVKLWGVYGIICATIIPLLFVNNVLGVKILYQHYFKQEAISEYFVANIKYFAVTVVAAVASYTACSFIPMTLTGLLFRGMVSFLLTNVILLILYYRDPEFKGMKSWVLKKVPFKRGKYVSSR